MTPAEYAWAALDNMLADDADERRDGPGRRVYLERGREFAVLSRKGDELVVDFEPPSAMDELSESTKLYTPTPGRPGWLRFRRPATNDPRPALEADLGSVLCAAWRERNPPAAFRSIISGGGPYVCMQLSDVPSWGGVCDKDEFPVEAALYEKALRGPDSASILTLESGGWVLVLGTPDPLYVRALTRGGLFARAVSHSMDDDALEALLEKAPKDGWEAIGKVTTQEAVRAFDVATFGGAIADGNSLTLPLSPGSYEIAHRTWKPDADTELILLRFQ